MKELTIRVDADLAEFIRSMASNNGIDPEKYANNLLEQAINKERGRENDIIAQLKREIERTVNLMNMYREYGAYDTEPREALRRSLREAVDGEVYAAPEKADEWSLYDNHDDREDVAHVLHIQAQKVVRIIAEMPTHLRLEAKAIVTEGI